MLLLQVPPTPPPPSQGQPLKVEEGVRGNAGTYMQDLHGSTTCRVRAHGLEFWKNLNGSRTRSTTNQNHKLLQTTQKLTIVKVLDLNVKERMKFILGMSKIR